VSCKQPWHAGETLPTISSVDAMPRATKFYDIVSLDESAHSYEYPRIFIYGNIHELFKRFFKNSVRLHVMWQINKHITAFGFSF
jgi:hypothetical protein